MLVKFPPHPPPEGIAGGKSPSPKTPTKQEGLWHLLRLYLHLIQVPSLQHYSGLKAPTKTKILANTTQIFKVKGNFQMNKNTSFR